MKKYLLLIGLILTSFVSFSQVIPKPNPAAVGIGYKRLLADSTLFIPTGGEIPRLGNNNINRRSAIYADTINKKLWVFYPNDSTWKESGVTTINWDSVFNKPIYFKTKYDSSTDVRDSIQARLAIRDTAVMLFSYYNKTAIDARLNLKVNISDTAAMLLPYAKAFTVVKYSDTAAMLAPYLRAGALDGYVPNTRMLTINGVAQSLSADRTWSIAPGGLSGQILSKNSDTDYDYTWIDNFADWTSTVKEYVKAGQDITKGQAVYVSSSDGTNIIVSKASNATEATSSKVIGLLVQTLSTNGKGYVITEGLLSGLNTASATTGDPVWLGVDGNLIYGLTNKPYAPAHLVYIGVVVRSNSSNGEIFIQPQNGFELRELHDVSAQSPSNNDGLFYDSATSLWENKSIATALGYTPANNASVVHLTGNESITGIKTFYNIVMSGTPKVATALVYSKGGSINPATIGSNNMTYAEIGTNNFVIEDALSKAKLLFDNSVQTYTFPAATGTVALTSDIPSLTGYVPTSRTLTINGTAYDLSANRSWTIAAGVTSVSGTSPIISSGGATPAISIQQATTSASGYLSSTDWTTFNGKQAALTNPVTGTGTTNYLPKFTGTSTIGNSLVYDNGTNVGIGTDAFPTFTGARQLIVKGGISSTNSILQVQSYDEGTSLTIYSGANASDDPAIIFQKNLRFGSTTNTALGGYSEAMRITNSDNVLIGTTTDAGYKLDVNGTGRFSGNVGIKTSVGAYGLEVNDANGVKITTTGDARLVLNSSSTGNNWSLLSYTNGTFVIGRTGVSDLFTYTAAGSLTLGNTAGTGVGALYAGAATFSGSVGIGGATPSALLQVGSGGGGAPTNSIAYLGGYSTSTSQLRYIMNHNGAANAGIGTPSNGGILFGYGAVDGTITGEWMRITTGGNVGIGGIPVAYATTSPILSVKNTVNNSELLFVSKGATQFGAFDGNVIASAGTTANLHIASDGGFIAFGTAINGYTSMTERLRITSGGNLLVGTTTDSGAKLQVEGAMQFGSGKPTFKVINTYAGSVFLAGGYTILEVQINGTTKYIQLYNSLN